MITVRARLVRAGAARSALAPASRVIGCRGGESGFGEGAAAPRRLVAPPGAARATTGRLGLLRPLSTSSGGGDGKGGGDDDDDGDVLLGLRSDESSLPPPPSYVRDAVTGKWTDRTRPELTPEERRVLNLAEGERGDEMVKRVEDRWRAALEESKEGGEEGGDGFGKLTGEHERVARRVQEQKLAMGTIGRAPSTKRDDDDDDVGATEKPLSPRENRALRSYARARYGAHENDLRRATEADPDLIPHNAVSSGSDGAVDSATFYDQDLDLAYLDPKMDRRAFDEELEPDRGNPATAGKDDDGYDPFADLLPSDLNPARKVNRRHAKPLPEELLHQNNLMLLRRYTTPGGKIMNRVQSRLGARDQRKVAKIVKRARNLGLIPHLGQWKLEDHGDLREPGLAEACADDAGGEGRASHGKRDWEEELEQRGLWPLQNEREFVKRYYDMEGMMEHFAGPRGSRDREELERLLGGKGALVRGTEGGASGGAGGGDKR
ncbi:hypothetical protein ACHAWF_013165 [Thalassiosira exigua]